MIPTHLLSFVPHGWVRPESYTPSKLPGCISWSWQCCRCYCGCYLLDHGVSAHVETRRSESQTFDDIVHIAVLIFVWKILVVGWRRCRDWCLIFCMDHSHSVSVPIRLFWKTKLWGKMQWQGPRFHHCECRLHKKKCTKRVITLMIIAILIVVYYLAHLMVSLMLSRFRSKNSPESFRVSATSGAVGTLWRTCSGCVFHQRAATVTGYW